MSGTALQTNRVLQNRVECVWIDFMIIWQESARGAVEIGRKIFPEVECKWGETGLDEIIQDSSIVAVAVVLAGQTQAISLSLSKLLCIQKSTFVNYWYSCKLKLNLSILIFIFQILLLTTDHKALGNAHIMLKKFTFNALFTDINIYTHFTECSFFTLKTKSFHCKTHQFLSVPLTF